MENPTARPGLPSPLRRPDGRVQLGLGPGAWVVEGWDPDTCPPHHPAADLLRGLTGRGGPAVGLGSWTVLGDGELARRLRRLRPDTPTDGCDELVPADAPVVLVGEHLVPVGSGHRADLVGRVVLPVVVQSARIVVGPWTGLCGCPCLHCLDLHRRDRDAAWPALAGAFEDPLRPDDSPVHDPVVLELASSLTQLLLAAVLRGLPPAAGVGYEVGAPTPHLVTRRWAVHPACPWHRSGGR